MDDDIKKSALDIFNKVKETASGLKDKALDEYEKSGAKDEVDKKLGETKKYMDEKGITSKLEEGIDRAKEVGEVAGEHLDKLSGKEILELVEQRLAVQTEYNDVLATKLEEALSRIAELEKKVK